MLLLLALALSGPASIALGDDVGIGNGNGEHEEGEHTEHGLPSFDIRDQFERKAPPDSDQQAAIRELGEDVMVRWDDLFGTPKLIIRHGDFLTQPDDRDPGQIVLDFIDDNADLFKFDPPTVIHGGEFGIQQVAQPVVVGRVYNTTSVADDDLDLIGDYQATHVFLEQRRAGLRVFGAVLNFTVDEEGRIAIMGAQYDRNGTPPTPPDMDDPTEAILIAADLLGAEPLDDLGDPEDPAQPILKYQNVFGPGVPIPYPITIEPVVFPMPFGMANHVAWSIVFPVDFDEVYEVVIDAVDGELLYRRNQVHAEAPQGTVYTGQNPCAGGDVVDCTLLTPEVVSFEGWVDGNTTSGNNARAFHNPAGNDTNEGQPTAADQHFDFTYTDAIRTSGGDDITTDMEFVVTQAFYYVNMLHERYYALGFDEVVGNFQQDNSGKGGVEGDPVLVYVDWGFSADPQLCCNASMWTPADGTSPVLRLRVGLAPNNLNMHRAMNGDTVAHEWAHGLSNRLVGGGNLGSGAQTGAMGEGWSDAVATSLWNDPVYGQYNNGDMETGIRGVAYDNNTLTYGDLCDGGCQVHTDGRIWATVLWDMRTALRATWGDGLGTTRHEQLMVDGMKNTPTSPSYLDARDGILAADVARYGGANQCLIWTAFAGRGMGFSATSSGNSSSVMPAEDVHPDCNLPPSFSFLDSDAPVSKNSLVTVTGRVTDPNWQDTLTITVDWKDSSSETLSDAHITSTSNDPPEAVVEFSISHVYSDVGLFTATFCVTDNHSNEACEDIGLVIVGDADRARSQGYWTQQMAQRGRPDLDGPILVSYLTIIDFLSQVFHDEVDAATLALAFDVLNPRGNQGDMRRLLEVQVLAAWLNFANGAIGYDELVDTTGNGVADTPFADAMAAAESTYLDSSASRAALEAQKDILERVNLRDGG